mgnify:CR=1 FL=1
MPDPVFSVVISTYNRKDILPRAINSVLGQTFGDFELLVIDNGSTDGTEGVVRAIDDERLKYVKNPTPTDSCDGPRNYGIGMSRGAFISFLDDDDIWYPERLARMKKAIDENPGIPAFCHNENMNVGGAISKVLRHGPWSDDLYERLMYDGNCLSTCAVAIRKDVFDSLKGFDLRREFSAAADYDFWIRMAAEGIKIHFIDEALGEFFLTGENGSVKDHAYAAKLAFIAGEHISKYEKKSVFGMSRRGLFRLFKLYAIAARSSLSAGKVFSAAGNAARACAFLAMRPSMIGDILAKVENG